MVPVELKPHVAGRVTGGEDELVTVEALAIAKDDAADLALLQHEVLHAGRGVKRHPKCHKLGPQRTQQFDELIGADMGTGIDENVVWRTRRDHGLEHLCDALVANAASNWSRA